MIAKITKVGLPIGLQSALVGISFLLITVIVNGMGLLLVLLLELLKN